MDERPAIEEKKKRGSNTRNPNLDRTDIRDSAARAVKRVDRIREVDSAIQSAEKPYGYVLPRTRHRLGDGWFTRRYEGNKFSSQYWSYVWWRNTPCSVMPPEFSPGGLDCAEYTTRPSLERRLTAFPMRPSRLMSNRPAIYSQEQVIASRLRFVREVKQASLIDSAIRSSGFQLATDDLLFV